MSQKYIYYESPLKPSKPTHTEVWLAGGPGTIKRQKHEKRQKHKNEKKTNEIK